MTCALRPRMYPLRGLAACIAESLLRQLTKRDCKDICPLVGPAVFYVGGGLLPITVYQSAHPILTHRYREQAPSYRKQRRQNSFSGSSFSADNCSRNAST